MASSWLSPCYRLIAELLLHPGERDARQVERLRRRLAAEAPARINELLARFLADPAATSADEYVATLELSPPCPLYLGTYLFEEPTTCRDVGTSGRNGYMLELTGVYRHFGFELSGAELPDYLPVIVDFARLSLELRARDRIGLRRRWLELQVRPGLSPLQRKLEKYESAYAALIEALELAVDEDLRLIGDVPAWQPEKTELAPARQEQPACQGCRLKREPRSQEVRS